LAATTKIHEKGTYNLNEIIDSIKKGPNANKAGAIGLFIGIVREENPDGSKAEKLTIEAYEEKANDVLNGICQDLTSKPGIVDVQIHHLVGDFKVGDDLVYVAVAGGHRQEIFPVLRDAVERYKSEAPIFKKEHTIDSKGKPKKYWVSEKEHH
jgi:molybdopterin synthase catalytic subunit